MPTPSRSRSRSQARSAPAPAAPTSRLVPAIVLALALAGLYVSIDLWNVHHRAHAGLSSSCDISAAVNCTDVALSKYAVLLGVPLAAWGALAYVTVAGLAASALGRRRQRPSWPGGLLFALTGLMTLGAVALAAISRLVLHKFCYMCAISWGVSLALLVCSFLLVRRAGGVAAAVRADVAALKANRRPTTGAGLVLAALAVALVAYYARASSAAPGDSRPGPDRATTPPIAVIPPSGAPGSLVIYEFSDYLCPHCKLMHEEEKSILARRPDVRFVRRHFPLDNTCNKKMTFQLHAGSCELSKGGICAEQQGRFEAYDDLAFATQAASPGPEKLAERVGLNMQAFRDCLAAPETEQRLADDLQKGEEAGVNGTPALQVQGKLYTREMLPMVLGLSGAPATR